MISIIVRTRNEERWIGACLDAISRQTVRDYEVILVDNESTDQTVAKALPYGVTLVTVGEFRPGAAINRGIEASRGEIIVCLSGHCIPVNEYWLENLVAELDDEEVAGVYGRQEPLAFTSDLDKRDLLITFGLDRREQVKDSFFHNANSAFRRSTWERFPFDEEIRNIEDRIWAAQVQKAGYKLIYEPDASVYHHHGIHHEGDRSRARSIIRILESYDSDGFGTRNAGLDVSRLNIVAVIPVREEGLLEISGKPLYEFSIEHTKASDLTSSVIVSTDSEEVASRARELGVDHVFMRSQEESRFDVILEQLMQSCLARLEENNVIPDALLLAEPTFPFRNAKLLDQLVRLFGDGGFDTVIPAREEFNSCWMEDEGSYRRIDTGHIARQFKQPFYTGLKGLGCVCTPGTVRQGELFGEKVGLFKLKSSIPAIEVRTDTDVAMAETILSSPLFEQAIPR